MSQDQQHHPCLLRGFDEADRAFIKHSWLNELREGNWFFYRTPRWAHFENLSPALDKLVNQAEVVIACQPDKPERIMGYAVGQTAGDLRVIHYVYIKQLHRGFGVARKLVQEGLNIDPEQDFTYTFPPSRQHASIAKRFWNGVPNWYLVLRPEPIIL